MSDVQTVACCEECGAELEGRSDKRFCNDACRKKYARRADAKDTTASWLCTRCGQSFGPGEWACPRSHLRHVAAPVSPRTYLLADAPSSPVSDYATGKPLAKHGRTLVTNIPPPSRELGDQHDGGTIVVEDGRYVTADPIEIYLLDQRGGWVTPEQWEAAWLSPEERDEKRREGLRNLEQEIVALRLKVAAGKGGV